MPSWELFDDQPQDYRDSVLPPNVTRPRVGRAGLDVWLGQVRRATGCSIGMISFGASAPLKELTKKFGFTPERVMAAAREQLRIHATADHARVRVRRSGIRMTFQETLFPEKVMP